MAAAAANYTAECLGAVSAGVDFYQMSTSADVALRIVKDCQDQGFKGTFGASGGTADDTLIGSGADWAGGINGFPWWSNNPAVKEYRDVMTAAKVKFGAPTITGMWANLQLLRKSLSKAGASVTRADVIAAYNSISGEDLGGLLPQKVTFTAGKTSSPVNCVWVYVLKADKFTSPEGDLTPHCFSTTPPKA